MEKRVFSEYIALGAILIGLLHTLRNLTDIYYIAYTIAAVLIMFLSLNRKFGITTIAFIITLIYVTMLSYISMESYELSIGIIRFCFVAPFAIYFISTELTQRDRCRTNKIFLAFICACAISLLYQLFYEEITWFPDKSFRSGVTKYSTLAGNENAFGAIAGVGLLLAFNTLEGFYYRLIALILIIIAGFASLQKMAIVTMVLAVCIQLVIYGSKGRGQRRIILLYLALSSVIAGIIFFWIGDFESPYVNYATKVFSSDASEVGDVSISESALDRMSRLPLVVINYWGGLEMLVGVGLYGAGGVLGYSDIPMAHNFIVEMVAIFGIFVGGIVVLFVLGLFVVSIRYILKLDGGKSSEVKLYSGIYILLVLGGLFTGGFIFHPVTGIFFWFVVAHLGKTLWQDKIVSGLNK